MNIQFVSRLAPLIKQYLDLKHALGYLYKKDRMVLASLDRFLSEGHNRFGDLTPQAFLTWSQTLKKNASGIRRERMQVVRHFCLYRRRYEPDCFVPDTASFPLPHQVIWPYIFSGSEVARLLDLCSNLPVGGRSSPHRRELFRLIIIILFTTVLRKGELLKLTIGDYDTGEGTLLLRCSKFHKSRLIPLRTDVCQEIDMYIKKCRSHQIPTTPETPFFGTHIMAVTHIPQTVWLLV